MRKPLIIANWKMKTSLADAAILTTAIKNNVIDLDVDIVLCPPFVWLYPIFEILNSNVLKNISLGAQNISSMEEGAVTGEVSAKMVKTFAKYAIIGHSERRHYFSEEGTVINEKIKMALKYNLIPVLCVGELKKMHGEKRTKGRPTNVDAESNIIRQLREALEGLNRMDAEKVVVAYEPVWAIGTGKAASGAYAAEVIADLRKFFQKKYNRPMSERVRFLYGGSVDGENIREFIYQPEIDGVLVGGAGLKSKEFIKICREATGKE